MIAASLGPVACADQESGVFPEVVGTWEWIRSEGGYVGDTIRPGRVHRLGNEVLIQITSDGLYRESVNRRPGVVGAVDTSRDSKFGHESVLPALSADTLWWFSRFSPGVETLVLEWRADTLLLTPAGWSDSYTHFFQPVEPARFSDREQR